MAPHFVVTGLAFAFLDFLRCFCQLFPGFRNSFAILIQQILAVIKHARIRVPRHGDQPVFKGVVDDDGRKMLLGFVRHVFVKINEVIAQDPRPDHINLEHIDIGRSGGQNLLIKSKSFGGGVRGGNHRDFVACLLCPCIDTFLAKRKFLSDGTTGNRNLCGAGRSGHRKSRAKNARRCEQFFHQGHLDLPRMLSVFPCSFWQLLLFILIGLFVRVGRPYRNPRCNHRLQSVLMIASRRGAARLKKDTPDRTFSKCHILQRMILFCKFAAITRRIVGRYADHPGTDHESTGI